MAASIRRNKDSCGSHTENCADRSWNLEDQGHDDREEPPKPARERHTTKSAREAHGRLGIVRPAPNRFRGTTIQWEPRNGPERVHDSSSFASSSAVSDCDAASSSSTAFLTIFLWMSGWGVIALRMTRRGMASVTGTPAGVAGAAPGAAFEIPGGSGGGDGPAPVGGAPAAPCSPPAPATPPPGRCFPPPPPPP